MKRRNTYQKEAIYETVKGVGKHLRAEDVKLAVDEKEMGIGLATIYRNLNLLCESGEIQKVIVNGETYYDGNAKPHDHLVCVTCGKLQDIENTNDPKMDEKVSKMLGAKIIRHSTTFEGLCPDCLRKEEERQWN